MDDLFFGNTYWTIGLFLACTILFTTILKYAKPSKKALGTIDLIWQSTLIIGLIFATAEIRKQLNTWNSTFAF